jgi:hypothetical protein
MTAENYLYIDGVIDAVDQVIVINISPLDTTETTVYLLANIKVNKFSNTTYGYKSVRRRYYDAVSGGAFTTLLRTNALRLSSAPLLAATVSNAVFGAFKVSAVATYYPTSQPTSKPSRQPTSQPSTQPSSQPTSNPTIDLGKDSDS